MALLRALIEKHEAQREADRTEALDREVSLRYEACDVMLDTLQAPMDELAKTTTTIPAIVRKVVEAELGMEPISASTPRTTPSVTQGSRDSTAEWSRRATAGTSEEVPNSQTSVSQGQIASRSQSEAQWSECARAEYRTAPSLSSSEVTDMGVPKALDPQRPEWSPFNPAQQTRIVEVEASKGTITTLDLLLEKLRQNARERQDWKRRRDQGIGLRRPGGPSKKGPCAVFHSADHWVRECLVAKEKRPGNGDGLDPRSRDQSRD